MHGETVMLETQNSLQRSYGMGAGSGSPDRCCRMKNTTRKSLVYCTREIKSTIAMGKAAFNKKALLTSKVDSNLRKKAMKCYIWSVAVHGAETRTLRKVGKKCPDSLEI